MRVSRPGLSGPNDLYLSKTRHVLPDLPPERNRGRVAHRQPGDMPGRHGLLVVGQQALSAATRKCTSQPRSGHRQPTAAAHVPAFSLSPAAVAWVDSGSGMHVGNVSNLFQRVVATINSDNQVVIETTGRIYWADADW